MNLKVVILKVNLFKFIFIKNTVYLKYTSEIGILEIKKFVK